MLEPKLLPQLENVNLQTEDIPGLLESIQNATALQLVNQTYFTYETYKTQNHDNRFMRQDQLYTGWLPVRAWPGTNIQRSNIGYPISFDQVESAHPAVTEALFGSSDWYEIEAFKGTPNEKTRLIEDHFRYLLTHARDEFGGCAQNELDLAVKDVLYRGNGGVLVEWDGAAKRPRITWVDIRDLYLDPALSVPNLDESRSAIRRKLVTINDLLALKDIPGFNIPDTDHLYGESAGTSNVPADQTKAVQEAVRGVNYMPLGNTYSPDPANSQLELLIYYDKQRIIWVLNRKHILYNAVNPYGFIPLCFAPCYIYPGRFHAQSIIDILDSSQRYIEALLNGRLDQVHLSLEPPRMMKRSVNNTQSNNQWGPGKIILVDSEKDYQLIQPQDILPNVFSDIEFLSLASERRTGINSFGMGVPRPGNVNRTAAGVNSQVSATSLRLYPIVKNIENYMLLPMLYKMYHMIKVHTSAYDQVDTKSAQGELSQAPASIFDAQVNFRINAASKMVTKEKLQATLPLVFQYLLNGPMMGQLAQSGLAVNIPEFTRLFQDATGTGTRYQLIRAMTPQEQQQLQQKEQQAQQAQAQEKQQEHQVRLQVTRETNQKDIQIAQMKQQGNENPMLEQLELAKKQQEMQLDAEAQQSKLFFETQLAKIKLQAEQQKTAQQAQAKQIEALLKQQSTQQDIQLKREVSENNAETQMAQNALNLATSQEQNSQKLRFAEEKFKQEKIYKPRLNESINPKTGKKEKRDRN